MKDKIDFVITWVDDQDENWEKEKNKYSGKKADESNSKIRYRDLGTLRYWFRGVEKFAPWVNKIYFVTCGQKPVWLNEKNSKLVLVQHKDYIPNEFLPTFNSNPIELFMNKIPNLSEKFVYFNDDMFITAPITEKYYFVNELPRDQFIFNSVSAKNGNNIIEHTILNNLEIVSKYYSKKDALTNNKHKIYCIKYGKNVIKNILLRPWKYYTGILNQHVSIPYLKSSWDEIYELELDNFLKTGANKFRTKLDINHWLIRYYRLAKGEFIPKKFSCCKYFDVSDNNNELRQAIINPKIKEICINDSNSDVDYEKVRKEVIDAFEEILPEKSSFEK